MDMFAGDGFFGESRFQLTADSLNPPTGGHSPVKIGDSGLLTKRVHHPQARIEVIGHGEVGDKARELIDKAEAIRKAGFQTPKRIVLSSDVLQEIFLRNNWGSIFSNFDIDLDLDEAIESAVIPSSVVEVLREILKVHGNEQPLAVRSSAMGDSRGTGIYESHFTEPTSGSLGKTVLMVLASYFSESAREFRRIAGLDEGFGIIIEPLIGNDIEEKGIGPILSGFGYTSTSGGGPYVSLVPGVGSGVESRFSLKVTEDEYAASGSWDNLIAELIRSMNGPSHFENLRKLSVLGNTDKLHHYNNRSHAMLFNNDGEGRYGLEKHSIERVNASDEEIDLSDLFSRLKQLESGLGSPQYVEWAFTIEDGKPVFWIIQIADVDVETDWVEFSEFDGEMMLSALAYAGNGERLCQNIVLCSTEDELESLEQYNRDHSGYILVYSSMLVNSGKVRGPDEEEDYLGKLKFKHFSNAAVVIESADLAHSKEPLEHFSRGLMDSVGMFFGVLDTESIADKVWYTQGVGQTDEHGFDMMPGTFRVRSSTAKQYMAVTKVEG